MCGTCKGGAVAALQYRGEVTVSLGDGRAVSL